MSVLVAGDFVRWILTGGTRATLRSGFHQSLRQLATGTQNVLYSKSSLP